MRFPQRATRWRRRGLLALVVSGAIERAGTVQLNWANRDSLAAEPAPPPRAGASFARLRWAAIIVPVAALVALDVVRHRMFGAWLHDYPGVLVFFAFIVTGVVSFASVVFSVIGRLERRVLEHNRQLEALNDIAATAAGSLELGDLLEVALGRVVQAMDVEVGVICLLESETDELVAACSIGLPEEVLARIARQPVEGEPIARAVVRTGCPVMIERLLDRPDLAELARAAGIRSVLSVPLKAEGKVRGVLGVASRRERAFDPVEVTLLAGIGGQLGMAVSNALLYAASQQRNQEFGGLLAVGRAAASRLDLSAMLDEALGATLSVTSAEAAEVWLAREDGELVLERHCGDAPEAFGQRTRLRVGEGLPGLAAQSGSAVVVHDLGADLRAARSDVSAAGFETYCALPLRRAGKTLGVLGLAARDRNALAASAEIRLLEGIGEQMALAVDNAQLHEQVLDMAVVEERERISRDLHDGLGQVLGFINTEALAIRKLLSSGRADEALREVMAIEEAARELSTDLRTAISGLRLPLSHGLVTALETSIAGFRAATGLSVELEVHGDSREMRMPATSEVQLLRIVQEALSNVRKHASAAPARVTLCVTSAGLELTVNDAGPGFDPERLAPKGWPRFGLQTMRERAESIGGCFEVVSAPGIGTTAIVRVPAAVQESVSS